MRVMKAMSYRSPLARVIGLGSAREGSAHWWWQRLTAIALVPLSLWFVFSVATMTGACFLDVYSWLAQPWTATLLISFLVCLFYHAQLGMQVVIEDYVHREGYKIAYILLVKFLSVVLVIFSLISVLQISF